MGTIAVTGAAGHVGANLVRALLDRGHTVRALIHRDRRALQELDVEVVQADINDLDSLIRAFTQTQTVYHAAGYVSIASNDWKHLESVNILGTQNVLDACVRCGVKRLVHFSSIEALVDKPMDSPMDEDRPLVKLSQCTPYARSKAIADQLVREASNEYLDAVILYPTAILGPFDYRLGYPNMGLLAICNGQIPALIDGGFDWVDVRDVADGAIATAEKASPGEKYILSGNWASLQDLARLAEDICGTRVPRWVLPIWLGQLGAPFVPALSRFNQSLALLNNNSLRLLKPNRCISHQRATINLGYHPRPLKETVIDTLKWFQQTEIPSPPLRSPFCDT